LAEQRKKNRGARPFCAKETRYLEQIKTWPFATEMAESNITALMIEGRAGIPAFTMPMTQGDAAAPEPPLNSLGSL
jgi:hypothetical protein